MENITKHAQRNAEAKAGKEAAKKNAKQTKSIPNFRRHSFDGMGGGYQGL